MDLISRVIGYADARRLPETPSRIGPGGFGLVRSRRPTPLTDILYTPLLCVVLQGRKESRFGDRTVGFGAGDALIVSVDLPTVSRITEASADRPYVALAVAIDLAVIRGLRAELELDASEPKVESIASGTGSAGLRDAVGRLFDLVERSAVEQRVLQPLLVREIHFRMLMEGHGGMLRRLSRPDSHASRINRAILKLRRDYAQPISVNELADLAGMSLSSFHEHFKAVTATTPLRFQKDIRLLAARQRLADGASVASAAFEVGYESPSQFSREYARKFGRPPSAERGRAEISGLRRIRADRRGEAPFAGHAQGMPSSGDGRAVAANGS